MSEPSLRFDVTTRDWVVFAPQRSARPKAFTPPAEPPSPASPPPSCAFCPGHETETLPAVDLEADPDAPERWLVRAFPNKYPALRPDASTSRVRSAPLFQEMGGRGAHEVVVCSPDHARQIAQLPEAQVTALLRVLQRRQRALYADPKLELVQIFQNHGERAGASLRHPHLQIVATPVVPRQIRLKYQIAADYYQAQGVSLYQDLCRAELEARTRIVLETPEVVAFTPFASRYPYQTWIVPREPAPSFDLASASSLPALGRALRDVMRRIRVALGDPAYNLTFFGAPRRHADEPDFGWFIEIVPRLELPAGFELATGMAINNVLPERAAESLRAVDVEA